MRTEEQSVRDEDSGLDFFDALPDPIVLIILNKLGDIKALGRCCAVSRRFRALTAFVERVTVRVDCVISADEDCNLTCKGRGFLGHILRLVFGSIVRPLQLLHHFLGPKKTSATVVSHHSPGEVLRNFKHIRDLKIELPGGELGTEDGAMLKWKAEFGSTLESCVILGAASFESSTELGPHSTEPAQEEPTSGCIPDSFYTDGGLKKRVVWTISSLIAASARHYLLQQIISDHLRLESLVLTDADGQGVLSMGKKQLREFRDKPVVAAATSSASRTQVPDLNMKLWYAQSLSVPGGYTMKGVTLVAIQPSGVKNGPSNDDGFVAEAFAEPFRSAARALARRRTYLLEMNSF